MSVFTFIITARLYYKYHIPIQDVYRPYFNFYLYFDVKFFCQSILMTL